MKKSILVAINDSASSRLAIEYLSKIGFCQANAQITLLHIFRKPSASQELMGPKYIPQQQDKFMQLLENAKSFLISSGLSPADINLKLVTTPFSTVAEGIISEFNNGNYEMIVIGRRRMSKAEEFVMGDVGVKLVRAMEKAAILVVKS